MHIFNLVIDLLKYFTTNYTSIIKMYALKNICIHNLIVVITYHLTIYSNQKCNSYRYNFIVSTLKTDLNDINKSVKILKS